MILRNLLDFIAKLGSGRGIILGLRKGLNFSLNFFLNQSFNFCLKENSTVNLFLKLSLEIRIA